MTLELLKCANRDGFSDHLADDNPELDDLIELVAMPTAAEP
jgi:hypothetical protein